MLKAPFVFTGFNQFPRFFFDSNLEKTVQFGDEHNKIKTQVSIKFI